MQGAYAGPLFFLRVQERMMGKR